MLQQTSKEASRWMNIEDKTTKNQDICNQEIYTYAFITPPPTPCPCPLKQSVKG